MPDQTPDPAPLPPVVRHHLAVLASGQGIYQHARGAVPDPAHGTCTDDVARALVVDLQHAAVVGWPTVAKSARLSLRYVVEALDTGDGRFRNFRSADGVWLDAPGSEDCHGRAMLALAEAAIHLPEPGLRTVAVRALERAAPFAFELQALRAVASASLACTTFLAASETEPASDDANADPRPRRVATELLGDLATRLEASFPASGPAGVWPWPEPAVTYEGTLPVRALIEAGSQLGREGMVERGLDALDWLLVDAVTDDGQFHPIGNHGWWSRHDGRAQFDQQPIEATSTILAARTAFRVTGDSRYIEIAEAAYAWFLGRNDLGVSVAVPGRGACHDGLEADGLNPNQGAESTLMWLTAVECIRQMRAGAIAHGSGQGSSPMRARAGGRGQSRTYART